MATATHPLFTVDLEDWDHALHINREYHSSLNQVHWIKALLKEYNVIAIIYVLEAFKERFPEIVQALERDGHVMQSHGKYHIRGEKADRQPYANLGMTGGFWFRLLPLWFLKKQIYKGGQFYIHPHDLDFEHPKISPWWLNIKRHIGVWGAYAKLERLLQEVKFGCP